MRIAFSKVNGAGNDFILIDNRSGEVDLSPEQVAHLCHRQNGIGADGLILQEKSQEKGIDWKWNFYNSDGSSAEMCGNGARGFARFVKANGSEQRDNFSIGTIAGVVSASVHEKGITVGLTPPTDQKFDFELRLEKEILKADFINTGVPHAILFLENEPDSETIMQLGRRIRYHSEFSPSGTNVNFVTVLGQNHINIHTYERGVEGETLACGTGVSASALAAAKRLGWLSPVKVDVKNGDRLEVGFSQDGEIFNDVTLTGPAEVIFTGNIDI